MWGKALYNIPLWFGPFLDPRIAWALVHWAALFFNLRAYILANLILQTGNFPHKERTDCFIEVLKNISICFTSITAESTFDQLTSHQLFQDQPKHQKNKNPNLSSSSYLVHGLVLSLSQLQYLSFLNHQFC